MNPIKKWHHQTIAKQMVEKLKSKHFNGIYAENLDEARKIVLNMIPEGASIGLGGSVTFNEMNLLETFREPKYKLFDRYKPQPWEDVVECYRQALLADYLVTSTNAITRNGELVNVDCSGNRVAGMIMGPKNVIIIAGVNKVVDDLDEAFKRLKKIAPLNAKRIGHKTPCAETGVCMDCQTKERMCNYTTIIHHGMKYEGRTTIILVAEEIGF
ncbi:MAG: lactate utilization protein [Hyphomonadaceae bacterium]|nr:lactate utilization protein [Clostridia bacterium]